MDAVMSSHYVFCTKIITAAARVPGVTIATVKMPGVMVEGCNGGYGHIACSEGGRSGGRYDSDDHEVGGGDSGDQVAAAAVFLVVLGTVMVATVVVRPNWRSGGLASHSAGGHGGICFGDLKFYYSRR